MSKKYKKNTVNSSRSNEPSDEKVLAYPQTNNCQILSKSCDFQLMNYSIRLQRSRGFGRWVYKRIYLVLLATRYTRVVLPKAKSNVEKDLLLNIQKKLGLDELRFVMLIGRSKYKKNIFLIYKNDTQPVAAVKQAVCGFTTQLVSNEEHILLSLEKNKAINSYSPKLLNSFEYNGNKVIVQEHLGVFKQNTNVLLPEHFRFLQKCISEKEISISDSYLNKLLQDNTVSRGTYFENFSLRALELYASDKMLSVIEHGDFTPTNILGPKSIVDWEHAVLDGLPMFDLFFYYEKIGENLYRLIASKPFIDVLPQVSEYVDQFSIGNGRLGIKEVIKRMYILYTIKQSIKEVAEGMEMSSSGFSIERERHFKKYELGDIVDMKLVCDGFR